MNLIPLPYKDIGAYPTSLTQVNIIKRFIDGLGYRYYWATESLTKSDLNYRINIGSRSLLETLEHILDISGFILRVSQQKYNTTLVDKEKLEFNQIRSRTLNELKEASLLISQMTEEEIKSLEILIQQEDAKLSLPLWHVMNGPISDALYHVGQVVSFRRASGNPINPNTDTFTGNNKE
ncbi:DinB family protein [Thalassobellus citreus]|uniref:DinB family protein n=1 Tax=Thalassobellus citreus TaxID=3367752 RepID=UPI0037A0F05A